MRSFRDIPIKSKMTAALLGTTFIALLVACTTFLAYERLAFRQALATNLNVLADVLARNSTAALSFADLDDATETLNALRAKPSVEMACLYNADGTVFATYSRGPGMTSPPGKPEADGTRFASDHLAVVEPVAINGKRLGTIYIRAGLTEISAHLLYYAKISAVVLLSSLVLAFVFSVALQRAITRPIFALTKTAKEVALTRDYSTRATKHGQDEIGMLTDSFNQMLDGIQERDSALHTANAALQAENAERKQAESALRESEERLNFALKKSRTGGWDLDLVDHTAYRSVEHDRIFGYDSLLADWTYEIFLSHVLPEDRTEVDRRFQEATAAQKDWSFECRIRRATGNVRWIWVAGEHQRDAKGNPRRMAGIVQDITDRKRAEEEVRKLNAELEQRVEERTRELQSANASLSDFKAALDEHAIVAITDSHGKITYANDKFCAISKYPREELLGQDHRIVNSGYHPKAFIRDLWETISSGRVWKGEIKNRAKDGSFYWVNSTLVPFPGPDGKPSQYIAIRTDITKRKEAEERIEQLNANLRLQATQLEISNKELESFSYSVSHDLRAPLRAVDGFSRMVLKDYATQLDADGQRMLGVIRSESQRMGRLIDDLLAFSRLGRQQIELTTVDMEATAQGIFKELATLEPERKLRLDLQPLPAARGSAPMIRQIWVNLISNAIKFTKERDPGVVEIGVKEGENGEQIYYIKDNGAGFDMRFADKLFGVFQRLHSQAEFTGTGVGLALVQRIVQRHGGRIWAEAEVNKGATFYFTIPNPKI